MTEHNPHDAPHPERVLLVDDDQKLLQACQLYLGRSIDIQVAQSGEEALQTMQSEAFSVVISDMHMPCMSGVEFIRRARELAPTTVYMLLTADRQTQTAVEAFNDANVFCVINKPCALKELAEFIQAAQAEYQKNSSN